MTSAENISQKQRPVAASPRVKNATKTRGRPFAAGNSGRPPGAKNKNRSTVFLDAIGDDDLQAIIAAVVKRAKTGDPVCARLIIDRLVPVPRARTVEIGLSAVGRYDAADALLASYAAVTAALAAGAISPSEAGEIISVLDAHRQAITDLRPDGMGEAPTPEQVEMRRRAAARQIEIDRSSEAIIEQLMNGK
jgi:hypothetical protein